MIKISKKLKNLALKLDVEIIESDNNAGEENSVSFFKHSDESEEMFIYSVKQNKTFSSQKQDDLGGYSMFFKANIWLPEHIKQELPYWISSEKQLTEVVKFLGSCMSEID